MRRIPVMLVAKFNNDRLGGQLNSITQQFKMSCPGLDSFFSSGKLFKLRFLDIPPFFF